MDTTSNAMMAVSLLLLYLHVRDNPVLLFDKVWAAVSIVEEQAASNTVLFFQSLPFFRTKFEGPLEVDFILGLVEFPVIRRK